MEFSATTPIDSDPIQLVAVNYTIIELLGDLCF